MVADMNLREASVRIEHRLPTISEYKKLRRLVGWPETQVRAAEKALANSLFSVVAIRENSVVGFGRVIGDGGLYFYIQDLIVHPDFQTRGLGKTLMKELMAYIKPNAESGAFIGLMAAKGLEKFYKRFGFRTRDEDAPGMYLRIE